MVQLITNTHTCIEVDILILETEGMFPNFAAFLPITMNYHISLLIYEFSLSHTWWSPQFGCLVNWTTTSEAPLECLRELCTLLFHSPILPFYSNIMDVVFLFTSWLFCKKKSASLKDSIIQSKLLSLKIQYMFLTNGETFTELMVCALVPRSFTFVIHPLVFWNSTSPTKLQFMLDILICLVQL